MKWISINEALPDEHELVLIFQPRSHFSARQIWIGYYDGEIWNAMESGKTANVSHWCSIPEVPKLDEATK